MSEKNMPVNIWVRNDPFITQKSFGLPVKNHIKYTLVHNNPEYHVIKKSDVDGDVMEALKAFDRAYQYPNPPRKHINAIREHWLTIRNALIAQSEPPVVDGDALEALKWFTDLLKKQPLSFGYFVNAEKIPNTIINALIAQSDPDMVRIWQPIKTMPKTGIYLVCQNDSVPTCINAKLYWEERPDTPKHLRFDHFTHWMPLPTPPISDVLNYKEEE